MATPHVSDKSFSGLSLKLPLSSNGSGQFTAIAVNKWPVSSLVDFIIQNHHVYVTDALPKIMHLLERVVTEYGLARPELEEIFTNFHLLTLYFYAQMRKEEQVLFPVIKELARAAKSQKDFVYFPFESIRSQVEDIEQDHATIEESLANIRKLTNHFTVPENVCHSYHLLFQWLEELEKDIYQHEYLENTVLFTKAIALEDSLR